MSNENKDLSLPGLINLNNLFLSEGKAITNWQILLKDINNELYPEEINFS